MRKTIQRHSSLFRLLMLVAGCFDLRKVSLVVASVVLLLLPVKAMAQTASTGVVSGTVRDPTGAVVPGARVELLDTATNQLRVQTTNEAGSYTFTNLPPGIYKVTVSMSGFRTAVVPAVRIQVMKAFTVDVTLEIGQIGEAIEVTASAGVELQKADSTVGNVVSSDPLLRLPSLQRDSLEFLTLQVGSAPETVGAGGNADDRGGAIAGARSDQNTFTLDGIDITEDVIAGFSAGDFPATVIPVPVESVEEFRVGVSNYNASFGRASGGQVALVGRRGTNTFHGSAYWFHQNDNLNANSWTNNRTGLQKPEVIDNRFGFRAGGPVLRDKTFFFGMFEGREFRRAFEQARIVPTATLRQGILRFRDAAGNIVSYNLATSRLCGPNNDQPCDPRGLGLSPSVASLWSLLPEGNDPTLGDGLNLIGFRTTAAAPQELRFGVVRLNHNITENWRLFGSGIYSRDLPTEPVQLDIRRGQDPTFVSTNPRRGQLVMLGLDGNVTSTFITSFRFGWTRERIGRVRQDPSNVANLLGIRGTDTSAGRVALDGGFRLIDDPIDVDTQRARTGLFDTEMFHFVEDATWIKGSHTLQFGAYLRDINTWQLRNDKVIGALSSLVATLADGTFINIPETFRPPVCSRPGQTNCLAASDVDRYNQLFTAVTGMVDNVSILITRDGSLNPLPLGTPLISDTDSGNYEFYAQDTWQVRPSLTVTLGLHYGFTTPPKEVLGRQALLTNLDTGEIITFKNFIEPKRQAALEGRTFNPLIGFTPIRDSRRDNVFDTDWNNLAPRLSAAWNPSFGDGFLGKLFGQRKTVLRGGFGVVYDRLNSVQTATIPMGGVGFAQTVNVAGPKCNATGAGGAGCNPTGPDPLSAFRVGVDGTIPLPQVAPASSPVIPALVFGDLLSFNVDPDMEIGTNYVVDFTIQRELPADMLVELGYIGRLGRRLPSNVNLNTVPFFQRDPVSGQTFAQAFDAVAEQLRAGVPAGNVTPQPFFQNQVPGGTALLVSRNGADFINGNVSAIFRTIDIARLQARLAPFNNLQVLDIFFRTNIGRSNYNAGFVTLRKRLSHGLAFDLNYTFSKSLDQQGGVQRTVGFLDSAFVPDFSYGPSAFDRTHIFNANFLYDLPAGRGHRFSTGSWFDQVLGGWQVTGIFRAASGVPLIVSQGVPALGGGALLSGGTAAIPTVDPSSFGSGSPNAGVRGSGGIGTTGDPANGGSGLNMFSNPEQVFRSFRRIRLSQDGRSGLANPLRSDPTWNLDLSLGKSTRVTERVGLRFSFDFFNIFNHVDFDPPSLSLLDPRAFGVITSQVSALRRLASSRWIQFGFRVDF